MTTNGGTLTPFKEGTIKHACFVALERAGAEGLTVRARDGRRAGRFSARWLPDGSHLCLVLRHGPCFATKFGHVELSHFLRRASRSRARSLTADCRLTMRITAWGMFFLTRLGERDCQGCARS